MEKIKELMNTKYNHKEVEEGKYEYWLKEGFFTSGDISKTPYTIVISDNYVHRKYRYLHEHG